MAHAPQVKIPATYIRGGTSKGVFFRLADLPASCQQPGAARSEACICASSAAASTSGFSAAAPLITALEALDGVAACASCGPKVAATMPSTMPADRAQVRMRW